MLPNGPQLLFFFETDCPTCRLISGYLNTLAAQWGTAGRVVGISQDPEPAAEAFRRDCGLQFETVIDSDWRLSRRYDPSTVPALFLLDADGRVIRSQIGFDKAELNDLAAAMGVTTTIAPRFDGNPDSKPGCMSRHREPVVEGEAAEPANVYGGRGTRASRIEVAEAEDAWEYAARAFGDPLPVVPPTEDRVRRMVGATPFPPEQIIGLVPPCYGAATVEKIAANAVMAGCEPRLMRVLIPLVRAACDERLNIHGVQATTHFAAPLVIVNGPVRHELNFWSGGNVFSNVARSNSTLGRALQLILINLGGARPGEIDMSTLGNPGKFSYCIAENEEQSPWPPLHADRGLRADESAVSIYCGEGVHGVGEHTARSGKVLLKAVRRVLATVWSYRVCLSPEALVVFSPEHVRTLARDGFSKEDVRRHLWETTGIPLRHYDDEEGDGAQPQAVAQYERVEIDGEPCYRKFRSPEAIHIVVAGGTAGKFSAVIGSWVTGPRGSQMVTYPVE
jgi:hypothetical protein